MSLASRRRTAAPLGDGWQSRHARRRIDHHVPRAPYAGGKSLRGPGETGRTDRPRSSRTENPPPKPAHARLQGPSAHGKVATIRFQETARPDERRLSRLILPRKAFLKLSVRNVRTIWKIPECVPKRSGCPANGKLRSAGGPCPLNYLENRDCRSLKTRRPVPLSQQGCQQTRRRQRRNWRVRAVERGQRSEPAWLRAHPGRNHFDPEKPPGTQILRNVWDTRTAATGAVVKKMSGRELPSGTVAPQEVALPTISP